MIKTAIALMLALLLSAPAHAARQTEEFDDGEHYLHHPDPQDDDADRTTAKIDCTVLIPRAMVKDAKAKKGEEMPAIVHMEKVPHIGTMTGPCDIMTMDEAKAAVAARAKSHK